MTRLVKTEAPVRWWWTGKCPSCGSARAAVEVGEMDTYSRNELSEHFGYVVEREAGPVNFQPHKDNCKEIKR